MHKFLGPVLQKVHFAPQVRHLRGGFNVMRDFPFDNQNKYDMPDHSIRGDTNCGLRMRKDLCTNPISSLHLPFNLKAGPL